MQMNPVIVKELRGRMRGARATITISVHLIAIAAIMMLTYASIYGNDFMTRSGTAGRLLFYVVMGVQVLTLSVISVTSTTGAISGERERQTLDVLLVTQLSPRQIIFGKLFSALAYCGLLIVVALPLEMLALTLGGVGLDELLVANVALAAMAFFYGVIGLYCSSLFRTSTASNGVGFGAVLFLSVFWPLLLGLMTAVSRFSSNDNGFGLVILLILLSVSPTAAFIYSASAIVSGFGDDNLFLMRVPGGNDLYFLHPWLIFVIFALVVSVPLMLRAARHLQASGDRPLSRREIAKRLADDAVTPSPSPSPNTAEAPSQTGEGR